MKEIIKKIKEYDTIIIHGHQRPDGDCYGSQFGLKEVILANFKNKNVYVVGEITTYVSFLGTPDTISDDVYKDALCICVDTGNGERVSDQRFFTGKETIKIDHHIPIDAYAQINYVDDNIPACAQIIAQLAIDNKLTITKEAAFALYTGMVTDTGRFRHGIKSSTFTIAAKLIDAGVDAKALDNLLSVESLDSLKLKGHVLSNFVTSEEGVVYAKIPLTLIEELGVSQEEASNQVGVIGTIESCPIFCLFIENKDGIRGRLRSRGPAIDAVANKFNGGGHKQTCGITLESFDGIEDVIKELNVVALEYKKQ
ncbi:MAG: bifunctional oligoribonuclease/PAP phosphatase NrnA [bacterium]